jgi:CRISPR-associated protein Cas1
MQLVLDTKGLALTKKGEAFEVIGEKSKRVISPEKLTSIAITATVSIHSNAVVLAIKNKIPILFFDAIGKAKARMWSPYFESIATLRRWQVHFTEHPEATVFIIDLFELKLETQLATLKLLKGYSTKFGNHINHGISSIKKQSKGFAQFRDKTPEECRQQLMGVEGSIARVYWQTIGHSLPRKYAFQSRSRRPAKDIFNAALNYMYGMLYSVVEGAVFAAGLDPHLGILHADEHNKPTLAFDMIEPFRPWVDQLLVRLCLEKKLEEKFFTKNQYGLFLNKEGKALIIPAFNDFVRSQRKFLNQEASVKNHIYFLGRALAHRVRSFSQH